MVRKAFNYGKKAVMLGLDVVGPLTGRHFFSEFSSRVLLQSASESDSGIYKCFSKKIFGGELKSEEVELLVLKDWEEAFENDSKVR